MTPKIASDAWISTLPVVLIASEIPTVEKIKLTTHKTGSSTFIGLFNLDNDIQSPRVAFKYVKQTDSMQQQPKKQSSDS